MPGLAKKRVVQFFEVDYFLNFISFISDNLNPMQYISILSWP